MCDCIRHASAALIGVVWIVISGTVLVDTYRSLPQVRQNTGEHRAVTANEEQAGVAINADSQRSIGSQQETAAPRDTTADQEGEAIVDESILGWSPTAWIAFFTVILAGIAIVQVCVYAVQAGLMRQGLAETKKSANAIKFLNKQWLDTTQWRCMEMPTGQSIMLGITCIFRNNTKNGLTLERTRVYVNGRPIDQEHHVPLAPSDRHRVAIPFVLTAEETQTYVMVGLPLTIVGCAYFTDVFTEPDRTLFVRHILSRRGQAAVSHEIRQNIALMWQMFEDANQQNQQKGQPQPESQNQP